MRPLHCLGTGMVHAGTSLLPTGVTGLLARIKDIWVVQYSPAPSLGVWHPLEQPSTIKALCHPGQKLLSPHHGYTRCLFSAETRSSEQQSHPPSAIKRLISQQRAQHTVALEEASLYVTWPDFYYW